MKKFIVKDVCGLAAERGIVLDTEGHFEFLQNGLLLGSIDQQVIEVNTAGSMICQEEFQSLYEKYGLGCTLGDTTDENPEDESPDGKDPNHNQRIFYQAGSFHYGEIAQDLFELHGLDILDMSEPVDYIRHHSLSECMEIVPVWESGHGALVNISKCQMVFVQTKTAFLRDKIRQTGSHVENSRPYNGTTKREGETVQEGLNRLNIKKEEVFRIFIRETGYKVRNHRSVGGQCFDIYE